MTWRRATAFVGGLALVLSASPVHAAESDAYLDTEIDAEMIAASTIVLDPSASTIVLDPDASTIEITQTVEEDERTVVSLTSDLLFNFDSADLTVTAREAVADLASDIPEAATVDVVGHTDSIGDDAYNDDLSLRRAEAVATVLREIRSDLQLTVTGRGERELIVHEGEGDQSVNRRVEVSYEASRG